MIKIVIIKLLIQQLNLALLMKNFKTVIVDDNPFDLVSIQDELLRTGTGEVVGVFLNGADFLQALQERDLVFDLLVLDYRMPILGGLDTLKVLSTMKLNFKVLMVSHGFYRNLYTEMQSLGFRNYCRKDAKSYLSAIPKVMSGVSVHKSLDDFKSWERKSESLGLKTKDEIRWRKDLSPTEIKIIRFISKGYNSKEIASILGYETSSIEKYRGLIVKSLELRSSSQLVSWAFANGLVNSSFVFDDLPKEFVFWQENR
jgi:DNA-binding NarL/FixJ family response regulator